MLLCLACAQGRLKWVTGDGGRSGCVGSKNIVESSVWSWDASLTGAARLRRVRFVDVWTAAAAAVPRRALPACNHPVRMTMRLQGLCLVPRRGRRWLLPSGCGILGDIVVGLAVAVRRVVTICLV